MPPGWSRWRRVVCLRSGLRPSLRHTTRTVPQLSHEHWYKNWGGVNWGELVQVQDECDVTQTSPDELPVIDIRSL